MPDATPMSVFNYEVFISYKSEEASWATRLAESLRLFGLSVWRDRDPPAGIRVGELWDPAIENAIRSSRTMVVLWSKRVSENYATTVVRREVQTMAELIQSEPGSGRRFVPISLDGTSVVGQEQLDPYH